MYETASNYHRAKVALRSQLDDFGSSPSLLGILALEVLFKAILLVEAERYYRGHHYQDLWIKISSDIRQKIKDAAALEFAGHADFSDMDKLLGTFEYIFMIGRYEYEKYKGKSALALKEQGQKWVEAGASMEEADFVYYPLELHGLTLACCGYLEQRLGIQSSLFPR